MSDKKAKVETTKYMINKTRGEDCVIELPTTWKVTFSSVNPASQGSRHDGYCVRIYEMPGSKLRAVIGDASGLRDLAIPLAYKVKAEVGESKWSQDSTGSFSRSEDVKVNTSFVLEAGEADDAFDAF